MRSFRRWLGVAVSSLPLIFFHAYAGDFVLNRPGQYSVLWWIILAMFALWFLVWTFATAISDEAMDAIWRQYENFNPNRQNYISQDDFMEARFGDLDSPKEPPEGR